ncbi:hypothetical protein K493DRAFT_317827 [Basidiobolus meristosporus CBS 931.73]|uniref:Uncharacterized protein n=1 Tax=Basidiobolus meristosporus CBS 931.73 TaxID=1314790 RepID=A0A1Y1XYR9_9FUNG|nr:hypothetical protein K493DRAFT_317827 [Basidiobolus meristosporus CBS 931.73]|eukprot:ORX90636.1 hypothetical protein K493DRAFT_317827 [Basidiobolus meristosporus CBS 931.73]
MFSSIARNRVATQALTPVFRRHLSGHHTTAQYGKAKGLGAPLAFLTGSAVFTYGLMWISLPSVKKQTA